MNRARENFLSALSRFEEALGWEEASATRDRQLPVFCRAFG